MKQFIDKIGAKQDLTFLESKEAFKALMEGKANDQEIFDFLTLLSEKGESSDEIAGGVYVLREKSKRVNVDNCIDTCGTGGDGMNTLNISTASALFLASMDIKVAKHGNKAVSSKCGSGDVLEALNININLEPNEVEQQIKKNMPSCVMIFLIPPSKDVLLSRLKNRGTDSEEEIENRFNQAVLDLNESSEFDHVLVNDQIDEAVDNIVHCIQENLNETNQSSKVEQALESFFETN